MGLNLRPFCYGPSWPEISIPDWFKERTAAIAAQIGDDSPDVKVFQEIINAGHFSEESIAQLEEVASTTQSAEALLLAIDASTHCFCVVQVISHMVPAEKKAA